MTISFQIDAQKKLWMGELVPENCYKEIKALCHINVPDKAKHPNFLLPYSTIGKQGFKPLDNVVQQAICQVLAHAGCIPSSLIFGLSLSHSQPPSKRVICADSSLQYIYFGLEQIIAKQHNSGFLKALDYIAGTRAYFDICKHLTHSQPFSTDDPVIQFARACANNNRGILK